ncbi:MAG: PTS mannitol transporter subunit IICB [Bacillota bacterium]|nr:PTS mannitol transporter subunit IICB [Bacillota bacterium]
MQTANTGKSFVTKGGTGKAKVQKFGSFLSGMVMPNLPAFIAWGLITAIFIPAGWIPDAYFAKLVDPTIKYLLPLLIGYTGGKIVYGTRGGVVGAIATIGVVIGASIPMFLGAMIVGPLAGYLMKKFDKVIDGKIPMGFEMLVNNYSAGILAMIFAMFSYWGIGPVVSTITTAIGNAAQWITDQGIIPLISLIVEPGKVLFLNNAINHGVFDTLGVQQVHDAGKSIFFLLETNPGPGLGILLAYWLYGKGNAKQSAPGAIIIQFLGGIHEIYFPYILMNPVLLLAVIGGGMCADFVFVITKAGLVGPPAPGSIFAEITMAPRGGLLPVLAGVVVGAVVSFLIASFFVKRSKATADEEFETAKETTKELKAESKGQKAAVITAVPKLIVFACDAGMGSSAMGESILKKKLKEAGFDVNVKHSAVSEIPRDAEVVFTQESLAVRAAQVAPQAQIVTIKNFLDNSTYDDFIKTLKK